MSELNTVQQYSFVKDRKDFYVPDILRLILWQSQSDHVTIWINRVLSTLEELFANETFWLKDW